MRPTVDIHAHLLSSEVRFNRFYDKLAIRFFAKKFGIEPKALINDPYNAYVSAVVRGVRDARKLGKIVLFGVDARVDDGGHVLHKDITVCATNDDMLAVYEANKDVVIPFFSINPNRPDALELIDKYVALGFKGAKFLQNYWGVDTSKERYRPYFEKLAELNLPLIVHVGSESSVHSFKACESIRMLDAPLKAGVQVICAHMALSYSPWHPIQTFSKNPKHFSEEYFILLDMLRTHDNLYADISAILTPVRAKVLPHLSQQKDIHHKILFGTDFPVPFTTILNSYDISWKRRFEIAKEQNPFDRYIALILEYFDEESPIFSNYTKLLGDVTGS